MKSLFKYIFFGFCLLAVSQRALAQQPSNYNLFTTNPVLLNPASAGLNNCFNVFINRHDQWADLNGSPASNTFGVYGKIRDNMGLGAIVMQDKSSYLSYLTANILYSYQLKIADQQTLAFGVNAGVANNSLNTSKMMIKDVRDPLLENYNNTRLDAGAGALYHFDKIKISVSIPHFFDNSGAFTKQLNIQGSYDIKTSDEVWRFIPVVMARNYAVAGMTYDAHVLAFWKELLMGQVGYRSDNSLITGLGVNWKNFNLGYAYQYNVGSNYNALSNGSHEVQLIFKLCKEKPAVEVSAPIEK